jgi:hypothetical protein
MSGGEKHCDRAIGAARQHRAAAAGARAALDVKVILTPPRIIISLVILRTKYTGRCQNNFDVVRLGTSASSRRRRSSATASASMTRPEAWGSSRLG